jgi:predicted CopG family antitoxin
MAEKKLKHVAVDMENYEALSRLGGFHESFNDVIRRLLEIKQRQKEEAVK